MKPDIAYVYNKLKQLRFDFNSIDFRDFRSSYRYEPTLNRYVRKDDSDLFIDKNTFKPLEEELEYADKCHKLEEQLGCPLDLVLIPYFISGLKKVWYHNQWCDVVRVVAYEEATTPYMEVRCKDYDYLKFIPLTNYKKTFWLKEDKSE